jgi:hypothetical protein
MAAKERKTRADAGQIKQTARDARALEWLAQMYAAPLDVLARLLDASPGRAWAVVDRWRQAEWAETGKVDPGPMWVWPTRSTTTAYLGWDPGLYRPRPTTAAHTRAVGETRLWMEAHGRITGWVPERQLRHETGWRRRGEEVGHVPDGIAVLENGTRVAVEVELTAKSGPRRMLDVLRDVLQGASDAGADQVVYVAAPEAARLVRDVLNRSQEQYRSGDRLAHPEKFRVIDIEETRK